MISALPQNRTHVWKSFRWASLYCGLRLILVYHLIFVVSPFSCQGKTFADWRVAGKEAFFLTCAMCKSFPSMNWPVRPWRHIHLASDHIFWTLLAAPRSRNRPQSSAQSAATGQPRSIGVLVQAGDISFAMLGIGWAQVKNLLKWICVSKFLAMLWDKDKPKDIDRVPIRRDVLNKCSGLPLCFVSCAE